MSKNSTKNGKADHGSMTNKRKLSYWEERVFINLSSMFQSLLLKVKVDKSPILLLYVKFYFRILLS